MQKVDRISLQIQIRVPIKEFKRRLHSKKFIKLVSINNKKIDGFVFAEIGNVGGTLTSKRKIVNIHEIGVTKDSRGLGIGTSLINEIKAIGEKRKAREVILSVWSFNERAIKFYRKNGFAIQTLRMETKIQKEGKIMKCGTKPSKRVARCLKQIYQRL